jgi:hypothetical protein
LDDSAPDLDATTLSRPYLQSGSMGSRRYGQRRQDRQELQHLRSSAMADFHILYITAILFAAEVIFILASLKIQE